MQLQFAFSQAQAPWWLGLAALCLLAWFLVLRSYERRRRRRLARFIAAGLQEALVSGHDEKLRRPLLVMSVGAVALLFLSLAQPHWGRSETRIRRGSRDILVLLDTSESMKAQNPMPSRLERARQKISALVEACPGDRFGLIAFSGNAALQSPLTMDHAWFQTVLHAVDTDTLSEEGTNIEAALREAERVFEEDIARSGADDRYARLILLVSDGEEVSGDALERAKGLGNYAGIFALGVGTPEGATIEFPSWMSRLVRIREDSRNHHSALHEETLSKVALAGDGLYIRSTPNNADVDYLLKEVDLVRARMLSGEIRQSMVNRYRWPLAGALFLFFLESAWRIALASLRPRRQPKEA